MTNPFRPQLTERQRLLRLTALLTSLLTIAAVAVQWDVASWFLAFASVSQLVISTIWERRTRTNRPSPVDRPR